jgi:hypothetical protein
VGLREIDLVDLVLPEDVLAGAFMALLEFFCGTFLLAGRSEVVVSSPARTWSSSKLRPRASWKAATLEAAGEPPSLSEGVEAADGEEALSLGSLLRREDLVTMLFLDGPGEGARLWRR